MSQRFPASEEPILWNNLCQNYKLVNIHWFLGHFGNTESMNFVTICPFWGFLLSIFIYFDSQNLHGKTFRANLFNKIDSYSV
jgi:hypothetical protein